MTNSNKDTLEITISPTFIKLLPVISIFLGAIVICVVIILTGNSIVKSINSLK